MGKQTQRPWHLSMTPRARGAVQFWKSMRPEKCSTRAREWIFPMKQNDPFENLFPFYPSRYHTRLVISETEIFDNIDYFVWLSIILCQLFFCLFVWDKKYLYYSKIYVLCADAWKFPFIFLNIRRTPQFSVSFCCARERGRTLGLHRPTRDTGNWGCFSHNAGIFNYFSKY